MATMIRKYIYLEQHQYKQIKRLAKIRGVSEAEIIRQAIDQNIQQASKVLSLDAEAWEQALAFMQNLHEQGPSGESSSHHWQREDAYRDCLSRYDQNTKLG